MPRGCAFQTEPHRKPIPAPFCDILVRASCAPSSRARRCTPPHARAYARPLPAALTRLLDERAPALAVGEGAFTVAEFVGDAVTPTFRFRTRMVEIDESVVKLRIVRVGSDGVLRGRTAGSFSVAQPLAAPCGAVWHGLCSWPCTAACAALCSTRSRAVVHRPSRTGSWRWLVD